MKATTYFAHKTRQGKKDTDAYTGTFSKDFFSQGAVI